IVTTTSIPDFQTIALLESFPSGKHEFSEEPQELFSRIHPKFPAGSNHRLAQHNELAKSFQRTADRNLLGGEEFFVEAADFIERFSSAKDKTAARQPERSENSDERWIDYL